MNTPTAREKLRLLRLNEMKALSYITNALHKEQLDIVQNTKPLNAHNVLNALKRSYGIIKSTNNTLSMLNKLNNISIEKDERIQHYAARLDSLIVDLRTVDPSQVINDNMRKAYFLNGLKNDNDYKFATSIFTQINIDGKMSIEGMKQYFIDMENRKAVTKQTVSW